jgi:hypothetical protein
MADRERRPRAYPARLRNGSAENRGVAAGLKHLLRECYMVVFMKFDVSSYLPIATQGLTAALNLAAGIVAYRRQVDTEPFKRL